MIPLLYYVSPAFAVLVCGARFIFVGSDYIQRGDPTHYPLVPRGVEPQEVARDLFEHYWSIST